MIDLGAHIGLTSLWFAHRYGCSIIAVEPSPTNVRVARLNLERNGIKAEVIEAAVGPDDGEGYFAEDKDSNLGHIASEGYRVRVLSMKTLLSGLPEGAIIDLVKMDIEGGEGPLLRQNLEWLSRVKSIIAEFHPHLIDYPEAIRSIEQQGFRYLPAGSATGFDSADAFISLREVMQGSAQR
jgi:FkbM family methyltransferase